MAKKAPATLPEGFKAKDGIAWGSRTEGLLEIAYWNPKKKNAVNGPGQLTMARAIDAAQSDDAIKVIFIHGGLFYCSGNDLAALMQGGADGQEAMIEHGSLGVKYNMVSCLLSILKSKKPVVGLVRG